MTKSLFDGKITRRDFLNGTSIGMGAMLLGAGVPNALSSAPGYPNSGYAPKASVGQDWYGYGGVGDYALSHGNTPEVVNTAHSLVGADFTKLTKNLAVDEEYDVVIVGGGMAGLGAAWHFKKHAKPGQGCLLLDNHPVFGGVAKENEFSVEGETLLAPQGANSFFMPPVTSDPEAVTGDARYYAEFNIPRELQLQQWQSKKKPLNFSPDNYLHLYWLAENNVDVGHFFADKNRQQLAKNIWQNNFRDTPYTEQQRASLQAFRNSRHEGLQDNMVARALDQMSYRDYIKQNFPSAIGGAQIEDPFLAGAFGLGGDAISAWVAKSVQMPGTLSQQEFEQPLPERCSFPGGNSGFARYFLKNIIPHAIAGSYELDDIITGKIDTTSLDKSGQRIRIRLGSTALNVGHESKPDSAEAVRIVYKQGGQTRTVRAKSVVMASGGWINRHVIQDLPAEIDQAYQQFNHAPFMVANVALSNWRFLDKLGITACRWDEGFGASCNIRQPMLVGRHQPPLDPEKPAVLTFYVPFHRPGLSVKEQVSAGRMELFSTSYASYEKQIIQQMNRLFAASGFFPKRDVRGIILNRWGHAFVTPEPGFFFDTPDSTAPRNIVMKGYGRIAFGHGELEGFQHWGPAADQGRRAMTEALAKA
jgi:spermidine dehydrogenase